MSRVVVLDTLDHGAVAFEEPAWCIGHGWQAAAVIGRNDITHNSIRVKTWVETETYGREQLLTVSVTWSPFAELVPLVAVHLDVAGDYQAEDALRLAQQLRAAAVQLERVSAEAVRLRGEVL